jgi:hypothetical protein
MYTVYTPNEFLLELVKQIMANTFILTQFMRLDARYIVRMSNGEYVYVKANGIFHAGPDRAKREHNYTQDGVD